MRKIVVGVDGSPASDEALRWAMQEARDLGATLVAIHAWSVPYSMYTLPGSTVDEGVLEASARAVLTEALARTVSAPPFALEERVVKGTPEVALVEAAADADLLVVGASHLGVLGRLLLGSVSSAVMHRSPCPVVVVREPAATVAAPHAA